MDLRSPGPVPSIALSWLSPQDACFCSARGHPTAMTSILVLQSSKVTQVFASPTTPGPRSVSFWHCPLGFCSLLLLAPQGSSQAVGLPWLPSPLRTPTLPVNPGHLRGRPLPSIRLFSSGSSLWLLCVPRAGVPPQGALLLSWELALGTRSCGDR